MNVCVRERETDRQTDRQSVCVCVWTGIWIERILYSVSLDGGKLSERGFFV